MLLFLGFSLTQNILILMHQLTYLKYNVKKTIFPRADQKLIVYFILHEWI